jgi:hypothetical protein
MAHALLCRAKELDLLAFSPHPLVNSSLEDYYSTSGPDCSFPNADVSGLFLFLYHAILNILHVNLQTWYMHTILI